MLGKFKLYSWDFNRIRFSSEAIASLGNEKIGLNYEYVLGLILPCLQNGGTHTSKESKGDIFVKIDFLGKPSKIISSVRGNKFLWCSNVVVEIRGAIMPFKRPRRDFFIPMTFVFDEPCDGELKISSIDVGGSMVEDSKV